MKLTLLLFFVFLCSEHLAASEDSTRHKTIFVIDHLPTNTPQDAKIYIACDLDGWVTDFEHRSFKRNEHGKLQLIVAHDSPTLAFKLTRGTWESAEARKNGRARPNRTITASNPISEYHLVIDSWEDISYHWYSLHMISLVITAIQGVLLMIAINTIRNKNKHANSLLSLLLILITIALLGRASTFDPNVFNWQPKLLFIPEIILFTYGPIFYLYIHKLLVIEIKWKWVLPMFLPLIIQVVLYAPFLMLDGQTLIFQVIDRIIFPYFAITGIIALIVNTGYWFLFQKIISTYNKEEIISEKQRKYTHFLKWVLNIKAGYLCIWVAIVGIYLYGEISGHDFLFVSENLIDALWLLFSLIIFALAYYAVKHPEVLRERKKYKDQALQEEEIAVVQDQLNELLTVKKIFKNQDLTLEYLAFQIPTTSHTLSRIINEYYNQSFTDLINTFRINEFIKRVKEEEQETQFLQLAFEVGFNSKPTFNRVFKKLKGTTPREYFKEE